MGKRGPKPLPAEQRRVTLSLRVKRGTRMDLDIIAQQTGQSLGEIVDDAVANWRWLSASRRQRRKPGN